jgi:hypothetical protein
MIEVYRLSWVREDPDPGYTHETLFNPRILHLHPNLGSSNEEVYAELLGFDLEKLHRLKQEGVI